jgi:hypothetical protein
MHQRQHAWEEEHHVLKAHLNSLQAGVEKMDRALSHACGKIEVLNAESRTHDDFMHGVAAQSGEQKNLVEAFHAQMEHVLETLEKQQGLLTYLGGKLVPPPPDVGEKGLLKLSNLNATVAGLQQDGIKSHTLVADLRTALLAMEEEQDRDRVMHQAHLEYLEDKMLHL